MAASEPPGAPPEPEPRAGRPGAVYALLTLLLFQGLSGLGGGVGLLSDPSGQAMGMSAAWLDGSPFADFLVPGLVLLVVLGAGPLAAAWGVWRRAPWAWAASVLVGGALVVWIAVQIAVIGYRPDPPLQTIYLTIGLAILAVAPMSTVRRHLTGPAD